MQEAKSLKDLLLIRNANREAIESVNGNLGSALGIKKSTDPSAPDHGKPAILIFVPQKIAPKWLPTNQTIQKRLYGPNGLECPVDIVEGKKLVDFPLIYQGADGRPSTINWTRLVDLPQLSPTQLEIRDQLRGWSEHITPGAQLAAETEEGGWFGTLGCFARDRSTGKLGLVTNQHVANKVGQTLYYASTSARKIATVVKTFEYVSDNTRFDGLIDENNAFYRIDCAFANLENVDDNDINPKIPVIKENETTLLTMGDPLPLDINTMGPIGQRVIGVGRTMSYQKATIAAFAYEFQDDTGANIYTDYLLAGEEPSQFSAPGDSGKLILTDESQPRPVALLWGGWKEKLSNFKGQQDWTYAIDINYVLDTLNVEIVN